jgi:hypothetical protein
MSDYYKILVVGPSGKGKTYGSRTLDPATTAFINIENKPLPFKNPFKYIFKPKTVLEIRENLILCEDPKQSFITTVVFDSFSAFIEMLLKECRAKYKNFDIWNNYNEGIGIMFELIKEMKKEVIVIAHYETLNIEGDQEKRVKVKGKEWEGMIEKEFTIVLYADRNKDEKGVVNAWLDLSLDASSSKCPPDIFGMGVNRIDNDYQYLVEKVRAFAGR